MCVTRGSNLFLKFDYGLEEALQEKQLQLYQALLHGISVFTYEISLLKKCFSHLQCNADIALVFNLAQNNVFEGILLW